MDENVNDDALGDALAILLDEVPPVVRSFILSPQRGEISLQLMQKYGLHADTAATFDQAYLFLLLGVDSPKEFVAKLKETSIPHETVLNLAEDINQLVFKRLQHEVLSIANIPPVAYRGAPEYPVVSVPRVEVVEKPVEITPPVIHEPDPVPSFNLVQSQPQVTAPHPEIRTMQHDMEMLQHDVSARPDPSHTTPARTFQTASVPFSAIPTPQPIRNEAASPPRPDISKILPPTQYAHSVEAIKENTGDPYRESIS